MTDIYDYFCQYSEEAFTGRCLHARVYTCVCLFVCVCVFPDFSSMQRKKANHRFCASVVGFSSQHQLACGKTSVSWNKGAPVINNHMTGFSWWPLLTLSAFVHLESSSSDSSPSFRYATRCLMCAVSNAVDHLWAFI